MIVDRIEPCVEFWVTRFGFTLRNPVPGLDGVLVFASAELGEIEVMYQTRASVEANMPGTAKELDGKSIVLFIAVDDIDAVESALTGAPVVKPKHETFYGSTEIYVREPGGHVVGFAQMGNP
jgi:uncharacterized glyoxalase superfamily protein PhnB